MSLDVKRTVDTVDIWFKNKHFEVVKRLDKQPKFQLEYLLTLLDEKENYLELLFKGESVSEKECPDAKIYTELILIFVELLCIYRKSDVEKYVKKEYYPLENCLTLCQKYKINSAVAFLLHRAGRFSEAIDVYLKLMNEVAEKIFALGGKKDYLDIYLDDYKTYYESVLKVCAKNAISGNDEEKELWFIILDNLYENWQKANHNLIFEQSKTPLKTNTGIVQVYQLFNSCIKRLLFLMMSDMSFERIIDHVTEKHSELKVESFREIFTSMIFSYLYQSKILDSALQITANNLINQLKSMVRFKTKAISVKEGFCGRCEMLVQMGKGRNFYVFPCGHIFHGTCIDSYKQCFACTNISKGILIFFHVNRKYYKY